MLVVDRRDSSIYESKFSELPYFLSAGDVVVYNNTRVLNARFFGRRASGGKVEFLFLKTLQRGRSYEVLTKPARKLQVGEVIELHSSECAGRAQGERCRCAAAQHDKPPYVTVLNDLGEGKKVISAEVSGGLLRYLKDHGQLPLPPYIKRSLEDPTRYQTRFAERAGSSAAPTAGLHFTKQVLGELDKLGVERGEVTLNVGLGTFKPMDTEHVEQFRIHSEHYSVPGRTAILANTALSRGRKLLAVGTTSLRALESCVTNGKITAGAGDTDLFIRPGYKFQTANMLLTNFHLPRTTLFVLVTEFGGFNLVSKAYELAIKKGFRFLSFGDAMLVIR